MARHSYPPETRAEVLRLWRDPRLTASAIARRFLLPVSTVTSWARRAGLDPKGRGRPRKKQRAT